MIRSSSFAFAILTMGALFSAALAQADSCGSFEVSASLAAGSKSELVISIQDEKPVANACDYYVKSFEYLSALKAVSLELGSENCMVDLYGKRKAELKWTLPASLRSNSHLKLVINARKQGLLVMAQGKPEFKPVSKTDCDFTATELK